MLISGIFARLGIPPYWVRYPANGFYRMLLGRDGRSVGKSIRDGAYLRHSIFAVSIFPIYGFPTRAGRIVTMCFALGFTRLAGGGIVGNSTGRARDIRLLRVL